MGPTLLRSWVAGAVLSGLPSTVWTLARGRSRWSLLDSTRAAGTLLGKRSVVRGAVAHAAISLWWTLVMQRAGVRTPTAGAAFGAGIAALDLGVIARRYPAIRSLPIGPQVADHLAFGAVVGWMLSEKPSAFRR